VLAKHLQERVGHRPLVFVHHREYDRIAPTPGLRGGDHDNDHDRHQQQRDQRRAVPGNQPEVLQGKIKKFHSSSSPLAPPGPYFLRMRPSTSSTEVLDSSRASCVRKLAVRLRSSIWMSVASQWSPWGRSWYVTAKSSRGVMILVSTRAVLPTRSSPT